MPRPSNTAERRRQIADGLAKVMATEGYDRATTAAIAAQAGVAAGVVHYHFASKAEILRFLVEDLIATARARVDGRVAVATSPRERLHATLDGLLATGDGADPAAVALWALIGAEAVRSPEVRALYAGFVGDMQTSIKRELVRARREAGRPAAGAAAAAAALVALTEGYFALSAGAGSVPEGSAAPTARRVADALISAP